MSDKIKNKKNIHLFKLRDSTCSSEAVGSAVNFRAKTRKKTRGVVEGWEERKVGF